MENQARLVAKVLRELLQRERFEDRESLREALKCRCARLRIRDYGPLVDRALALVGSNVRLPESALTVQRPIAAESSPPPFSATEARRIYAAIMARAGTTGLKPMPPVWRRA